MTALFIATVMLTIANLGIVVLAYSFFRQAKECADLAHIYEEICFKRWLEIIDLDKERHDDA